MIKVSKTAGLIQALYKERNAKKEAGRIHGSIGASQAGEECDRKIWLDFHWVLNENLEGRIYHLFEEGNRQEDYAVDDLKELCFDIRYTKEDQMRIELGSSITCYPDGLILSGVPEAPNKVHNFERKTMNTKDFKDVKANGVKCGHPEHWYQMQVEMYAWNYARKNLGLDIPKVERSLYLVLCKETSEEYAERVDYEKDQAEFVYNRLALIANCEDIPTPLSKNATFYKCKWCKYNPICHPQEGDEITIPNRNCRTCRYSRHNEGIWHCLQFSKDIPKEAQTGAYGCHCYYPELIPVVKEDVSISNNYSSYYYFIDDEGKKVGALMGLKGMPSDAFLKSMIEAGVKYHAGT